MKKNRASDSSNGIFVKLGKGVLLPGRCSLALGSRTWETAGMEFQPQPAPVGAYFHMVTPFYLFLILIFPTQFYYGNTRNFLPIDNGI